MAKESIVTLIVLRSSHYLLRGHIHTKIATRNNVQWTFVGGWVIDVDFLLRQFETNLFFYIYFFYIYIVFVFIPFSIFIWVLLFIINKNLVFLVEKLY